MPWSVLQSCNGGTTNGSTSTATFTTANLSAGTKLVALANCDAGAGSTISGVSDGTNAFTQVASNSVPTNRSYTSLWILDTPAGKVGTKPTITATNTSGTASGTPDRHRGCRSLLPGNTSACLDGAAGTATQNNTTSPAPVPVYSSSLAGEFLFNAVGDNGGLTFVAPSGYAGNVLHANGSDDSGGVAWKNSTGVVETGQWSWTGGGTNQDVTILVAFKISDSPAALTVAPAFRLLPAPGTDPTAPGTTGIFRAPITLGDQTPPASGNIPGVTAGFTVAAPAGGFITDFSAVGVSTDATFAAPAGGVTAQGPSVQVQTMIAAQVSGSTTPSTSQTWGSNITNGNYIVVYTQGISVGGAVTGPTVSDSAGNVYTEVIQNTLTGAGKTGRTSVWMAPITVGGGTKPTVTFAFTSASASGVLFTAEERTDAFVGAVDVSAVEASASNTTTHNTGTSSAATGNGEYAVSVIISYHFAGATLSLTSSNPTMAVDPNLTVSAQMSVASGFSVGGATEKRELDGVDRRDHQRPYRLVPNQGSDTADRELDRPDGRTAVPTDPARRRRRRPPT